MTANTTQAAVSTANTMAENRTRESFRIRCFPNLSSPGLRSEDAGGELGRSNWDAIRPFFNVSKLCVCLDLQNYKYLNAKKLLKLVFCCGFLYFQFFGEIRQTKVGKSLEKLRGFPGGAPHSEATEAMSANETYCAGLWLLFGGIDDEEL